MGPVAVPASCVRDLEFDAVQEMLGISGGFLRAGVLIPSPCLAFFLLLELTDSGFFSSPYDCDPMDVGRALFLLTSDRETALLAANEFIFDRPRRLDRGAERVLKKAGDEFVRQYAEFVRWVLETPFNGLAMIPGGEPCRERFFFNAVTVSRLLQLGAKYGNLTPQAALWEVPLVQLGHLIACGCDADGARGIGRPKDPEDIRRQLKEAREREERGEKHPWQI